MVKGNQEVLTSRYKKDWDKFVRTKFNVPAKRKKRRMKRQLKAAKLFPRPVKKLRPIVRCPGRHNHRERLGRGFTPLELKGAKLTERYARTIGIAVDQRRKNRNEEGLLKNVQRLNEYLSKLVVYPLNGGAPKKGKGKVKETPDAEKINVEQVKGVVLPIEKRHFVPVFRQITDEEKKFSAFKKLSEVKKAVGRAHV